jgi:hypothetical protein
LRDEQEKAFDELRNAMVRAPVLALPNATDPFILDTDASDKSMGAELIQIQEGEEGSLKFISQVRLLWSVLTVKCLPNK